MVHREDSGAEERFITQLRTVFGELDFRTDDDGRSVYSPAAYLVELLGLLEDSFDRPSLLDRRPDLQRVVLDTPNTFVETPYLDIVNEVLERLVGTNPTRHCVLASTRSGSRSRCAMSGSRGT